MCYNGAVGSVLTHCGLVTPNALAEAGVAGREARSGLVGPAMARVIGRWHQAITWFDIDLSSSSHNRLISQEVNTMPIRRKSLKKYTCKIISTSTTGQWVDMFMMLLFWVWVKTVSCAAISIECCFEFHDVLDSVSLRYFCTRERFWGVNPGWC